MADFVRNPKCFVSVVVPCRNGMKTVGECLSSLTNQMYPKELYEVILVDNGSTDGTCELVSGSFSWVRLIHSAEKGSGYARNAGIREARGELILSTDSDCVVDAAWIMNMVSAFETAPPTVAAIGGKILPYSIKTTVERYPPTWVSQPDVTQVDVGLRYTATPNAGFRASILRLVGGFDGSLGFDDTDLGIRLLQAGYDIRYTDLPLVRHRNPSSLSELYRHKVKYGMFSFALRRKHPRMFAEPEVSRSVSNLLWSTLRRIMSDALFKLPIALLSRGKGLPRVWPVIDATMALGNFNGFFRAARSELASSPVSPSYNFAD